VDRDYLEAITTAFIRATGRGLMLSPKDQGLVARWYRAQIPKDIVVQGIESAFDTPPSRRVTSLSFVSKSVDRAAKLYRDRRVGSGMMAEIDNESEFAEVNGFLAQIDNLVSAADLSAYRPVFEKLRVHLIDLQQTHNKDADSDLGASLEELENQTLEACLNCMSDEQKNEIERDVRLALSQMPRLDPVTQTETERAFVRRSVRKLVRLPALEIRMGGGW
tara:strand:+ start:712 stop:1371 length:660 start_codon:yes stop_codon:yes gene_type:complete